MVKSSFICIFGIWENSVPLLGPRNISTLGFQPPPQTLKFAYAECGPTEIPRKKFRALIYIIVYWELKLGKIFNEMEGYKWVVPRVGFEDIFDDAVEWSATRN